ncbi:hypothetical protein Micbo1qcDRAFT_206164 [Microdochium bolleyi]|uniref:Uncharacterized protein n=1 Tax=Microdochium bolleyi TaxID=196109 RepID=A0A136IY73_9PEZI|nr:hypothetical protein Micbo1qcDRAFT_206164 [Microdochium bolleyi]
MAEQMKAQRQEARPKPWPKTPDYARTVSDILFYSAVFFKYMHTSMCRDFSSLHDPDHEDTASTYGMIVLDSLLFGALMAWLPGCKYQREWAASPLEAMLSFLMALAFGSAFVWPVVWGALLRILEH